MSLPINDGPEAREWLSTNHNASALATNRFGLTSEAIEFVEQIYATGVVRVFVPSDSLRDETAREGGFYSDTLIAEVGSTTDRAALLAIFAAECEHEGLDEPSELPLDDDRFLLFWWD